MTKTNSILMMITVLALAVMAQAETGTIVAHGQMNTGLLVTKKMVSDTLVPTTTVQVGNVVYEIDGGRHLISLPLGTVVDTKYEQHRTGARLVVTVNGKTSKCYVYTQRRAQ